MDNAIILTSDYDYELPEELIAQAPVDDRTMSKMMVLDRVSQNIEHKNFFNIIDYLSENDVLVLNDTKVIHARLFGQKTTGANVEVFLLKQLDCNHWEVLLKPSKRINVGNQIFIDKDLSIIAKENLEGGKWLIETQHFGDINNIIERVGKVPLPPYIERKMTSAEIENLDKNRYQTVFAKNAGSVAAPTAGLHFSKQIIKQLEEKGVQICYVTLNVGLGTFKPVKCENILEHKMEIESYEISQESAKIINEAKLSGKNIVAVGTTSVRTLETAFLQHGKIIPCRGTSQLFIYPPYKFNVIDKIITNFHLPKSTLIMLVSAFAGKDFVFKAYDEAIKNKYRFYSYGDCMFLR